jgi:hypothetical protein
MILGFMFDFRRGAVMRVSVAILGVAIGIFTLSMSGQSQVPPSQIVPKPNFLNNISEGEKFLTSPLQDGLAIQIVTDEELRKLSPTDEERRQYEEVRKLLDEVERGGNSESILDNLSDEMKALRQTHRSLGMFASKMQLKIHRTESHAVTRVGHDFLSYRDGDHQVFLPAHRINSITRPVQ